MSHPPSSAEHDRLPSYAPNSPSGIPTSRHSASHSRQFSKSGITSTSIQELLDDGASYKRRSSASMNSAVRYSENLLNENFKDSRWSLSQDSRSSKHGHHRSKSFGQRLSFGIAPLNPTPAVMRRSESPSKRTRHSEAPSEPPKDAAPIPSPMEPSWTSSLPNARPLPAGPSTNGVTDHAPSSFASLNHSLPSTSVGPSFESKNTSGAGSTGDLGSGASSPRKRKSSEDYSYPPISTSGTYSLQSSPGDSRTVSLAGSASGARVDSSEMRAAKRDSSPRKHARRSNDSGGLSGQQRASDPARKNRRDKEQKALSKALQRAHEAVALDNAQNYTEATRLYEDACGLLSMIMSRSSEKDREKLERVRSRYAARIEELQNADLDGEPSPDRTEAEALKSQPAGTERQASSSVNISGRTGDSPDGQTGDASHGTTAGSKEVSAQSFSTNASTSFASSATTTTNDSHDSDSTPLQPVFSLGSNILSQSQDDPQRNFGDHGNNLRPPNSDVMPRPLTPRRTPDSENPPETIKADRRTTEEIHLQNPPKAGNDNAAWLGPNGQSMDSTQSSVHSMSSMNGIQRKHLRTGSGDTEAEFDAALDAAVEAAYGEGYELFGEEQDTLTEQEESPRQNATQSTPHDFNVPLDREAVISAAKAREAERRRNQRPFHLTELESSTANDSDEEERLLDEVTSSFIAADPATNNQQISRLPRQSDSSTSSGRTWGSSVASSLNTAGTSLSTVEEKSTQGPSIYPKPLPPKMPPPAPPPKEALPIPPPLKPASLVSPEKPPMGFKPPPPLGGLGSPSVQDRRGSGQRAKKLKIETTIGSKGTPAVGLEGQPSTTGHGHGHGVSSQSSTHPSTSTTSLSSESKGSDPNSTIMEKSFSPIKTQFVSSPFPSPFPTSLLSSQQSTEFSPPTPSLTSAFSTESSIRPSPQSASPGKMLTTNRSPLKQDPSLLSVKKQQHLLPTPTGESFETSPASPMSFNFSSPGRRVPMNTPVTGIFQPGVRQASSTTTSLFENDIHANSSPHTPRDRVYNAPKALEPCPESFLLRPFWLMRCIHQTLTHPRGGYLSNKVFIPRELWKAKNVKLKGVEDKIANCDLLTAALLKLSSTDTLDADAVLEEMQAFESVLDQAQASLTKKLGSEVGVSTISSLFKDAPPSSGNSASNVDLNSQSGSDATNSKSNSKGYLSSWRKLRSKNSSANLAGGHGQTKETPKDLMTMSTIPMTAVVANTSSRQSRRDAAARAADMKYDGPNAQYMSALSKLCDAAQILDQIARQVEDPGLKHSSPTHVGLELSTRHASEFFAFYVCRFILQDITLLAEKFIKRASEWVLS